MATIYAGPALFSQFGPFEITLIVLAILLLFGGRKIPELARGLGRGLREFKKGTRGIQDEIEDAADAVEKPSEPTPARDEPTESSKDKDSQT